MTTREQTRTAITIRTVVQRTGLSRIEVLRCVDRGLVGMPFSEADLVELRRARRLQDLGLTLQGIEVIHRMRRRIVSLEATLGQRQAAVSRVSGSSGTGCYRHPQRLLPAEPDETTERSSSR